jgi:hypothetical protein
MSPWLLIPSTAKNSINNIITEIRNYRPDFVLFCLQYWGLNSEPTPWATPSALFLCVIGFLKMGLMNYLPRLDSNLDPPDLCLLSSYDYRPEPPAPSSRPHILDQKLMTTISKYLQRVQECYRFQAMLLTSWTLKLLGTEGRKSNSILSALSLIMEICLKLRT